LVNVQPQKKLAEDDTLNNKGADDSTKQAAATYSSSRYWVTGTLVSAVALGVIIATSGLLFGTCADLFLRWYV
jgi:hypothetical protein